MCNINLKLKTYKPVTPGLRNKRKLFYLKKKKRINKLCGYINYKSGRNNSGKITIRHKGGRVKRIYRRINFFRYKKDNILSKVSDIQYDPYRNSNIALLSYIDGYKSYILAPDGLKLNDSIISSTLTSLKIGNNLILKNIPERVKINSIEFKPGFGAKIARSAGCYAYIISKNKDYVKILLKSGKYKTLSKYCRATIGEVSNKNYFFIKHGKAGIKRYMGVRPTVRGVAMNPIDHPHGGGEGKTSGGRDPVSV